MSLSLSIIIPAYNEEACMADSLGEIHRFALAYPGRAEILVVDDGSTDASPAIVESMQARLETPEVPLHLIRHSVNRGKGASVRTGFFRATGDVVMFTDADLSAPMTEAEHLIRPIADDQCDVVVGSRAIDPTRIIRPQGVIRRYAGRLFNMATRSITGVTIRDTQCGFKAFRRDAAVPIFARQRLERFAFDVELLYLADRFGLRVKEVAVRWSHVEYSTVSTFRDGRRMFFDLCRIRWNDWTGRYRRPADPPTADEFPDD